MDLVKPQTNGKVEPKSAAKSQAPFSLMQADKEAVRVLWSPFIRPGIDWIKEKDPQSGPWMAEHVRSQIERGFAGQLFCECHLIYAAGNNRPVGFVVLKLYLDEFVQVPLALYVWLTYCAEPKAMRYVLPAIERRARDLGLRYVVGVTSRAQWAQRLRPFGYDIHQLIIRKDVDPPKPRKRPKPKVMQ